MHEAGLISDLMRQIEDAARREGARKVVSVRVWLGALSHMSAVHFAAHFHAAAAGTVAEGASLDVTVSDDLNDPHAQEVRLDSIDVESRA